jgi:hypothetical protein
MRNRPKFPHFGSSGFRVPAERERMSSVGEKSIALDFTPQLSFLRFAQLAPILVGQRGR